MIYFIRVLFSPHSWITVGRFSKTWDAHLNDLMKKHRFEKESHYTAKLGPVTVWIQNHPYSSFKTYQMGSNGPIPRRATMLKAMDKFDADTTASLGPDTDD